MKVVSVAQMRELDRRAAEEFNIPTEELMDRAGDGVAEIVERLAGNAGFRAPFIQLIAGRGNNGGDAFAAAHYLKTEGLDCEVWIAGAKSDIQGDALKFMSRARQSGVPIHELPTSPSAPTSSWMAYSASARPARRAGRRLARFNTSTVAAIRRSSSPLTCRPGSTPIPARPRASPSSPT
jgi:hypothetical protein